MERFRIKGQIKGGRCGATPGGMYEFVGEGVTVEEAQADAQAQVDRTISIVHPDTPPTLEYQEVHYY